MLAELAVVGEIPAEDVADRLDPHEDSFLSRPQFSGLFAQLSELVAVFSQRRGVLCCVT